MVGLKTPISQKFAAMVLETGTVSTLVRNVFQEYLGEKVEDGSESPRKRQIIVAAAAVAAAGAAPPVLSQAQLAQQTQLAHQQQLQMQQYQIQLQQQNIPVPQQQQHMQALQLQQQAQMSQYQQRQMAQSVAYTQAQAQAQADAEAAAAALSPTPLPDSRARVVWKALRNGVEILTAAAEALSGGANRVGCSTNLMDVLTSIWDQLLAFDLNLNAESSKQENVVVASSKVEKVDVVRHIARLLVLQARSSKPTVSGLLLLTHTLNVDFGTVDFSFVKDFLRHEVPVISSLPRVRELVAVVLHILPDVTVSLQWKANLLQNLVTPVLFYVSKFRHADKGEVFDKEIISMLVHYALEATLQGGKGAAGTDTGTGTGTQGRDSRSNSSSSNTSSEGEMRTTVTGNHRNRSGSASSGDSASKVCKGKDKDKEGMTRARCHTHSRCSTFASVADSSDKISEVVAKYCPLHLMSDADASAGAKWSDRLKIELLRLSTLLLEYSSNLFKRYKNELIIFAWNFKKSDDSIIKYWACLNAARFLTYMEVDSSSKDADTTSNLTFQIYNQLMKAFKSEGKDLVAAALDAIVPVLPDRLKSDRFHKVMRLTKKITNEESSNVPHLVHVWQVIIRHWLVFYPYRHHFITLMLQSVNRLGLHAAGNASPVEFRHVAFGIAHTIVMWEQHRQTNLLRLKESAWANAASAATGSVKTSAETGAGAGLDEKEEEKEEEKEKEKEKRPRDEDKGRAAMLKKDDFTLNSSFLHVLVGFLVRLAISVADSDDSSVSCYAAKSVGLFKELCMLFNVRNVHIAQYVKKCLCVSVSVSLLCVYATLSVCAGLDILLPAINISLTLLIIAIFYAHVSPDNYEHLPSNAGTSAW